MKDETYIGHTIHYRETNISFKNKRRIRKPQSEWVRVENTQEPIISEQVSGRYRSKSQAADGNARTARHRFCGTDKVCRLRLVAGLRENRQEQQALWLLPLQQERARHTPMLYAPSAMMCFYAHVLSRLQYWSGLVQHDEEQLLKRLNANDSGQAAARKSRPLN